MNSKVADFINSHEEEIDTNDFHSVFTAAFNELNNDDTQEVFRIFSDTFDKEDIAKQRETALYFILSKIAEDMDPERRYSFAYIYATLMHLNILGLNSAQFSKYLRQNASDFDLDVKVVGGMSIYRKKEM